MTHQWNSTWCKLIYGLTITNVNENKLKQQKLVFVNTLYIKEKNNLYEWINTQTFI